jgi:hypothetical protein
MATTFGGCGDWVKCPWRFKLYISYYYWLGALFSSKIFACHYCRFYNLSTAAHRAASFWNAF